MTPFNPRAMSERDLQQLKVQAVLLKAKVDLYEKELETFKARAEAERQMFGWLANSLLDPAQNREPLRRYEIAHAEHCAAQVNLRVVTIEELRRDKNVVEEMIKELGKPHLLAPRDLA